MKIIASDYDGTIKTKKGISLKNKRAMKRWRKQGNLLGIVTGRSTSTIKDELKNQKLEIDFLVCNNGGVILNDKLEILQLSLIDFEVAQSIIAYVETIDCNGYVLNDGVYRARKGMNKEHDDLHNAPSTTTMNELLSNKKVAQIVVSFDEQEDANVLAKYINENFEASVNAFANVRCVDIVPKGVSKAQGIKYIVDKNKLNEKQVFAIGDSYNDMSMLEAYAGATFHDSPEAIQDIAKYVVKDFSEFVDILEKL